MSVQANEVLNLAYRPDWKETRARRTAWWNHEYLGRCALIVEHHGQMCKHVDIGNNVQTGIG